MRQPTQAGLDLIKRWESFSPVPYLCPANVWTIGYGCTRDLAGNPVTPRTLQVTRDEAETMLSREVSHFSVAVNRLFPVELTDGQFDALVSFAFNLGSGALQASTLRRKALRGDLDGAGEEFPKWIWAGGRKLAGLLNRRLAEQKLWVG